MLNLLHVVVNAVQDRALHAEQSTTCILVSADLLNDEDVELLEELRQLVDGLRDADDLAVAVAGTLRHRVDLSHLLGREALHSAQCTCTATCSSRVTRGATHPVHGLLNRQRLLRVVVVVTEHGLAELVLASPKIRRWLRREVTGYVEPTITEDDDVRAERKHLQETKSEDRKEVPMIEVRGLRRVFPCEFLLLSSSCN